ncbi:MAG: hypothetical protein FWC78_05625 [Defluviitaleaceae bacterium]|nr:hypothetical protein [Defluviitaleaceae bacterium]
MTQRLAFFILLLGVLGGYYLVLGYLKQGAKFFTFFNDFTGDGNEFSIRDRGAVLVFALKTWGVFALLSFMSFHVLLLPSFFFWIFMIYMQKRIVQVWVYHDYSRKIYYFLCALVVVLSFIVSPIIRGQISQVIFL